MYLYICHLHALCAFCRISPVLRRNILINFNFNYMQHQMIRLSLSLSLLRVQNDISSIILIHFCSHQVFANFFCLFTYKFLHQKLFNEAIISAVGRLRRRCAGGSPLTTGSRLANVVVYNLLNPIQSKYKLKYF